MVFLPPVSLPPLPPHWEVVSVLRGPLTPAGGHAETLLTSWRYHAVESGPDSVIPPGATMITVTLFRAQGDDVPKVNLCAGPVKWPEYPERTPPLALPDRTLGVLDGTPSVKEFRIYGRYRDDYDFEIRVDIDTRRAVRPRWAVAESIVQRLVFPRWPSRRTC